MKKLLGGICVLGALVTSSNLALAADVAAPAAAYDWSGVYIGADFGAGMFDPRSSAANLIQPTSTGVDGGLRLGANYQINQIVLGLEANADISSNSATKSCFNPAFNCNAASDWNGSIRARLGFAADRIMFYGTGGYGIANYKGFTNNGVNFPDNKQVGGWVAGAGVEYAVNQHWLLSAEYLHSQYSAVTLNYDVAYPSNGPTLDQVMLGIAYKF